MVRLSVCGGAWVAPKSLCCEGWNPTERRNKKWGDEESD